MNLILRSMMKEYGQLTDPVQCKNAVKQIMQEMILCGLSRSDMFSKAAFNGGTALRIFHDLNRFSEDLDFSVDPGKTEGFMLCSYGSAIDDVFASLGVPAVFESSSEDAFVKRGYVKGNCREILRAFEIDEKIVSSSPANEVISVKVEADTACVPLARFETRYLTQPYPSAVRLYDSGTLFAGKLSAVLQRHWKSRVKGRDLFDYIFYISHKYPVNMEHLRHRLLSADTIAEDAVFDEAMLKSLLIDKFTGLDFESAVKDVMPFVDDAALVSSWTPEMFISLTEHFEFREG